MLMIVYVGFQKNLELLLYLEQEWVKSHASKIFLDLGGC